LPRHYAIANISPAAIIISCLLPLSPASRHIAIVFAIFRLMPPLADSEIFAAAFRWIAE